ncbi:Homoserine/homoserine lactone efflux protein [Roseovarius gaetbuli]|uniref:Homoserine/homoserine lactone efflux protein n=1 Tax=Roseovarius gaetbuli TaxID=1356575 RepID=A0A1X6ZFV8_9RHOB|nr:LysE family translocator [Roseovarius gaetbuli]SLN50522.1 Homoserine/homoserine lactone efflux protein [Roseovarius gaetbuli]
MPPLEAILAVTLAGLALSATPGPSMLYVLSRSVGQSRAAGLASALGLGLGGMVLAVATALGLAAVFARFDWLVLGLRYVGSAYLVWLGVGMIRDARASAQLSLEVHSVSQSSFSSIIWQGVLVELLNPKTVLFFALFLPPFVDAGGGQITQTSVQLQLLTLGVLVPLTAIPSDIVVAVMGGTMTQVINRQQVAREGLAWAGGLILIAIALNLHFGFFG